MESITQVTYVSAYIRQATAHVTPHVQSTCASYVLYIYLYCVYVLVGGAISIRDPYICANESHTIFHKPVVCAVTRLQTSIEACFVGGKSAKTPELLEVVVCRLNGGFNVLFIKVLCIQREFNSSDVHGT